MLSFKMDCYLVFDQIWNIEWKWMRGVYEPTTECVEVKAKIMLSPSSSHHCGYLCAPCHNFWPMSFILFHRTLLWYLFVLWLHSLMVTENLIFRPKWQKQRDRSSYSMDIIFNEDTLCVTVDLYCVCTDWCYFFLSFFVEATKKNVENYTTFTVTGTVLD